MLSKNKPSKNLTTLEGLFLLIPTMPYGLFLGMTGALIVCLLFVSNL